MSTDKCPKDRCVDDDDILMTTLMGFFSWISTTNLDDNFLESIGKIRHCVLGVWNVEVGFVADATFYTGVGCRYLGKSVF